MLDLLVCNRVRRIFGSELSMENGFFFSVKSVHRRELTHRSDGVSSFYILHCWCRPFLKDYV